MELVDRYLFAVRSGLPKGQQDDIIAELAEDIRPQFEDLESGLGRPANEADVVEILQERGHPAKVAARYMPQQYLIGPALYPVYLMVLKIVVLWVLVPVFIFVVGPLVVITAVHPSGASVKTLWDLAMSSVFTVGVVTVVFAIVERCPVDAKPFEKWDPRKLPRVPKIPPVRRPTPRANAIAEIAASLIATTLYAAWFRTAFDLGEVHVMLASIWRSLYWPFLVVILSGAVRGWVSLVWPDRVRLRFAMRVAINAGTVILAAILLNAGGWVDLSALTLPAAGMAEAVKWTNWGVKAFLLMTLAIAAGDAIPEGLRIFRRKTQWHYSTAT